MHSTMRSDHSQYRVGNLILLAPIISPTKCIEAISLKANRYSSPTASYQWTNLPSSFNEEFWIQIKREVQNQFDFDTVRALIEIVGSTMLSTMNRAPVTVLRILDTSISDAFAVGNWSSLAVALVLFLRGLLSFSLDCSGNLEFSCYSFGNDSTLIALHAVLFTLQFAHLIHQPHFS